MASDKQGDTELETRFGERFVLRDTAVDTNGELLRIDTYLDPGVRRPLHIHPRQDERFIVHSGTLGLAVEDEEYFLDAGTEKDVSAGTPHTFWNAGNDKLHMTTEHRPALRFEDFLKTIVQLDREGGLDSEGMPDNLLTGAAVITEFQDEMQPADIPVPVQRVLFPILARIGTLLGYGVPTYSQLESTDSDSSRPL